MRTHPAWRALSYILRRVLTILVTIVAGVFVTVVVANHGGMIDAVAQKQVDLKIRQLMSKQIFDPETLGQTRSEVEQQSGLRLPFWPKHLLYTLKALTLDWGDVGDGRGFGMYLETDSGGTVRSLDSRTIILARLPNSLLLSGVAYLLLALVALPTALFLSQREGHWLDKLNGLLTPLSSVPSWVLGVLLVILFAAEIRLFPVSKMLSSPPPQTTWETIVDVAYHMVLPVSAIVLSLIFQLIYNWRTYLMIFSSEDYVEMAVIKGLNKRAIEINYILRPGLPYMLTSFMLTLVGFWQTITALEYLFEWPGIGKMYVDALPNFHGERMYAGEMSLVVGIVVLFAYLLGAAVFLLDILYVVVDPRLRLEKSDPALSRVSIRQAGRWKGIHSWRRPKQRHLQPATAPAWGPPEKRQLPSLADLLLELRIRWRSTAEALRRAFDLIRQSPAAMLGLGLVSLLFLGSFFVMVALPYQTVGREWSKSVLTGYPTTARLALPAWVNWFRRQDLPPTIYRSTQDQSASKQVQSVNGAQSMQIEFTFDYAYQDFPTEIAAYLTPQFAEKKPFVSFTWITPDGREFSLKNISVDKKLTYSFVENVPYNRYLLKNENWRKWFVASGNYPTPPYYILFADPQAESAAVLPGEYTLRLDATLFEEGSDLEAELVLFGQVEGLAGTDYLRRDLMVPLLWGLPFALMIGGIGAILTTIASLVLAAAGVWLGGWVDGLIQRAIEANLILPVIAIGVLFYAFYGYNLWLILGFIILLNIFGSPTKAFRAAFLQIREAAYIEAARVYGASSWRIIWRYLIPRILPVMIPQIVTLIPNFVFLEATLAIFNISDPRYPTWGSVIYSALRYGAS
jgi:peptide/nickel transport system permease protein